MRSVFTEDFDRCAISGIHRGARRIEVHHVFGASNRKRSTQYGFVVPLVAEIHPNGACASDRECMRLTGLSLKQLDLSLKQACQAYYEEHVGGRQEFIAEFGRSYL